MLNEKQHKFKIVLTGPESSGKTQMAQALAAHFKTNWAPEFARFYLSHLGRHYLQQDLQTIGKGQYAWECWHQQQAQTVFFCDTDWTVLHIWEQFQFGPPENDVVHWAKGYPNPQLADLYLLCTPDFPWQADPLRENPNERTLLFEQYENLLQKNGANYRILRGAHNDRIENAIPIVAKLFPPLP